VFIRRPLIGLVAMASSATLVAACGSSGNSGQAAGTARVCQEVSAVLSDGPDPGADPVGYALAQVRPLRQIKVTADPALRQAVDGLAAAYQSFYNDDGAGSAAQDDLSRATHTMNALCPGSVS
jgi:hypothetical protein